ncbi:MAG: sulfur carrier protein ThiS [Phycisphaerae bacterium]
MEFYVNGEKIQLPEGATIQDLLQQQKLEPIRVAVELNCDVVPKKAYAGTSLKAGDRVEIVTFVGGG